MPDIKIQFVDDTLLFQIGKLKPDLLANAAESPWVHILEYPPSGKIEHAV
jgi:hypothetical protein